MAGYTVQGYSEAETFEHRKKMSVTEDLLSDEILSDEILSDEIAL